MKSQVFITLLAILLVIGQRFWLGREEERFQQAIAEIAAREAALGK